MKGFTAFDTNSSNFDAIKQLSSRPSENSKPSIMACFRIFSIRWRSHISTYMLSKTTYINKYVVENHEELMRSYDL